MKFWNISLLFSFAILIQGCVFPMSHTIYTPKYENGKLVDSDVCGYMFNNKDTLKVERNNFSMKLRIYKSEKGKTELHLEIDSFNQKGTIDLGDIKMVFPSQTIKGTQVIRGEYGKSSQEGRRQISGITKLSSQYFYIITFSDSFDEDESVILDFSSADIRIGTKIIDIGTIQFTKEKVLDLFFATINC